MTGHVYCNPTQLCYRNWGSILNKDCTQIDKVHTLEFLDSEPENRWFNNVFSCYEKEEPENEDEEEVDEGPRVFTNCSYYINDYNNVVTNVTNRILISNENQVTNYTEPTLA